MLFASEVPAIAAFAWSGLPQERNSKKRERGTNSRLIVLANALGYQNAQNQNLICPAAPNVSVAILMGIG